ncbi:beta-1,4 N-acetylgalactosaminyltransferase 1-like [Saccoglossus kowalevskii]
MNWKTRYATFCVVGLCFFGVYLFILDIFSSCTLESAAIWEKTNSTSILHLRKQMEFDKTRDCSCPSKSIGPLDKNTRQRQKKEYTEWEHQESKMAEPMTLCPAMSPIQYLGSGITVEPLKYVRIVGIKIHPALQTNKEVTIILTSRHSLGQLYVESSTITDSLQIAIHGNGSCQLSINTEKINDMNTALSHLAYYSTEHDIRQRDYIDVSIQDFVVVINILIQRHHVPRLYDPGPGNDINRKVTIVAKTFNRYDCVNKLISSINHFYPKMTILIADDSETKQKLNGTNVKHFLMPFKEGYSAGKNLLVSQVRTKYFVWVDDDFVFTNYTILERFVEKLESPTAELDLVAGLISNMKGIAMEDIIKDGWSDVEYVKGQDGGCLFRRKLPVTKVKEFPNCKLKDMVINFFMAKTDAVRNVGFDLVFERIAHREFFIDALGYLRIAQCDDVIIQHRGEGKNKDYKHYRLMENQMKARAAYAERILFKNNLQCFQPWNPIFSSFMKNKKV